MHQLTIRQYEEREEEMLRENETLRQTLYTLHQTMQSIVEDTLQQDLTTEKPALIVRSTLL